MGDVRILGIPGGVRKGSYSAALITAATELTPLGAVLEVAEVQGFPIYNQDLESPLPEPVRRFKDRVRVADAVLFSLNEHNFGLSAAEKNVLDWGSRPYNDNVWNSKPAGILSASVGQLGGARAQYDLRQSMVFLNMFPINRPEVMVAAAAQKFDESGRLTDEAARSRIREHLTELLRHTRVLQNGAQP